MESTSQSLADRNSAEPVSRCRRGDAWEAHAAEHERTLEEYRDPALANLASRETTPHSLGTRGRVLASGEIQALADAATTVEWARIARRLMDDGVSGATISRAIGFKHLTASARLSGLAPPPSRWALSPCHRGRQLGLSSWALRWPRL